ncbi:unnamed protein product [Adineta ricciae]|uniref:Uncharacterized protein n=1 Tax=Adineta ricciae TaxID=249248 RepID=A0A815IGA6_ADIRI|nr:unnamed protein product [Adineta ricciae]CAF1426234.1 unnamed protein product [Adineta ricciae]
MATDIDKQTDVLASTTEIVVNNRKRRLWMIISIFLGLFCVAIIAVPTAITLVRKIDTITVSTSSTTSVMVITSVTPSNGLHLFKKKNEMVYAIWNTTAGDNSARSTPGGGIGEYWRTEPPEAAVDGNLRTEYTNHGVCNSSSYVSEECGLRTGFYLTFQSKPFILVNFQMATNKGPLERNPSTITIEGSNNKKVDLVLGKSWTLIYNGSSGLEFILETRKFGKTQTLLNNTLSFASYRFLITSKRGAANCVSYSEVKMMGRYPDE